eukprot:5219950-Amphidinium_carterae.1
MSTFAGPSTLAKWGSHRNNKCITKTLKVLPRQTGESARNGKKSNPSSGSRVKSIRNNFFVTFWPFRT